MGGIGSRCRIGGLVLLICVVLLSATMANGIRTVIIDGTGAPGPAGAAQAATEATAPVATAATTAPSEQAALDDPYKDIKRKVPNGPDPIHNRYSSHLIVLPFCSAKHMIPARVLVLSS